MKNVGKCHWENGKYIPCGAVQSTGGTDAIKKGDAKFLKIGMDFCPFCGGNINPNVEIKRTDLELIKELFIGSSNRLQLDINALDLTKEKAQNHLEIIKDIENVLHNLNKIGEH